MQYRILRRAWVVYLTSSRAAMTSLAEQYVGLPIAVSFTTGLLTGDID
jgi:hypothetical protein